VRPQSLIADVRGIGRDFAIDSLPPGFVWDIIDYIPNRRGARLEGRGPWKYTHAGAFPGTIWGGKHGILKFGSRLYVHAGPNLYVVDTVAGTWALVGTLFPSGLQNGVTHRDRVYWSDGSGAAVPKRVTYLGGTSYTLESINAGAPKAKLLDVYKDRIIVTADPAQPQRVSFSPLEIDGTSPNFGPMGTWDPLSYIDTSRAVSAFAPMGAQILAFHAKSIEKIRGSIPPGANLDSDMFLDMFSDQMGCEDPQSVCNWQENVLFANQRGVHLTDGATIRSLTDQGSIGDFWRTLYGRKRSGTQVVCGVFLDFLLVTVLTDFQTGTPPENLPVTLVCDLNNRSWFRLSNFDVTCWIESERYIEECWGGLDADKRLTQISDAFYGHVDLPESGVPTPPVVDSIDGDGKPVLPLLDIGFKKLGPEGVKRLQHIYVAHQTQMAGVANGGAQVLQVEYRVNPAPTRTDFAVAGTIPNQLQYTRNRVNVGRRGYGIQIVVRHLVPTYLTRLYDVAVGEWAQDRGKL
jgi:hypothetical protein